MGVCTIRSILPACRGSIGAIPPVWWRPRRGPSSTVHLSQRNSPRLLAARSRFGVVRSRFEVAWCPKCRPPRRQTPTMGCYGRGGLRCGHNGAWPRVLLAREPLNVRGNPLDTHVTLSICAWAALPTRESSGPGAYERARVRAGALGEAARRSGGGEAGPHVRRAHILGAISHSIRLSELSTVPTNIAIPTIWMRGATPYQGNRMRHLWIACPVGTFCPFTQLILEMRTAGGACLLSTREVSWLFAFKGVGGVGIRRSGGGSVGGSFGG